jgi:predicted GNAT family acetyltransferase
VRDKQARAIQFRGLADWLRWLGAASEGASVWEAPGVVAAVVPACPDRSIANSVAYADEDALAESYDRLRDLYASAGIEAWTVWTPEHDAGAIELLSDRGHKFDGKPTAMDLDLNAFDAVAGDLDYDADASFDELGRLNDAAYGYAAETGYARAMRGAPEGVPIRVYRARSGGETASVMATIDHGGDLGVYFVATPEQHHGKGLATRLLTAALLEARERGMRTSSLQSSAKGEGVYARLGYERRFRLHLYERRG